MVTRALTSRANVPFMVIVPDDPDALRLIRLLLVIFNFLWRNRAEILLLAENVNMIFDVIEAVLDMCAVVYDWWILCIAKLESNLTALNYI